MSVIGDKHDAFFFCQLFEVVSYSTVANEFRATIDKQDIFLPSGYHFTRGIEMPLRIDLQTAGREVASSVQKRGE
jgi:hypothetical protein